MPQPSHSGGVVGASTKQHQSGRCRGSGFLHASQSDGALLLKGFEFLIKTPDEKNLRRAHISLLNVVVPAPATAAGAAGV